MYRTGNAYHGAHPFFMWYWGEAGRQHMGRVIVVGADNDHVPGLMGWDRAGTLAEAIARRAATWAAAPDLDGEDSAHSADRSADLDARRCSPPRSPARQRRSRCRRR